MGPTHIHDESDIKLTTQKSTLEGLLETMEENKRKYLEKKITWQQYRKRAEEVQSAMRENGASV